MDGAIWVLLVSLLLFAMSHLVHRLIDGHWLLARLPITWFYASWLVGLTLLSLPLFKYFESFSKETAAYLVGVLFSFSVGSVVAAFWANRHTSSNQMMHATKSAAAQVGVSTRLLFTLLALGLIGTSLVLVNALLGGNLSIAERLDASNFAMLRSDAMGAAESHIGLLFGPASLMSAIGSLGVAYVFYLRGARSVVFGTATWLYRISVNTAKFMPEKPRYTSTDRIQARNAMPIAIAQSANTSDNRLTNTRRRYIAFMYVLLPVLKVATTSIWPVSKRSA